MNTKMKPALTMSACRAWLMGLGGILAFLLFAILLGQKDRYGPEWQRTWEWFVPTVAPTLGVIIGAVAASVRSSDDGPAVNPLAFRLAFVISILYLATLFYVELLSIDSARKALDYMAGSRLWLGAFQGLVSLAVGAFFVSPKTGEAGQRPAAG